MARRFNPNDPSNFAQVAKTDVTDIGALGQKRFDIGQSRLGSGFQDVRGRQLSGLGRRGLGGTTAFADVANRVSEKGREALQGLYGDVLGRAQQEGLQRDILSTETSKFNVGLKERARQFDEQLAFQEAQAEEAREARKRAAHASSRAFGWKALGNIGAAFATGGASLIPSATSAGKGSWFGWG